MMVGAKGFEPSTLWSQTRCATRLRYTPTGSYCSGWPALFSLLVALFRRSGAPIHANACQLGGTCARCDRTSATVHPCPRQPRSYLGSGPAQPFQSRAWLGVQTHQRQACWQPAAYSTSTPYEAPTAMEYSRGLATGSRSSGGVQTHEWSCRPPSSSCTHL